MADPYIQLTILARSLYKAIFPIMTPTIKNRTTSARSRVLRPSSLAAVASTATGLLLCAVFLIRRPSSSCGGKGISQSWAPEQGSSLAGGWGAISATDSDHMTESNFPILQVETLKLGTGGGRPGLKPPRTLPPEAPLLFTALTDTMFTFLQWESNPGAWGPGQPGPLHPQPHLLPTYIPLRAHCSSCLY